MDNCSTTPSVNTLCEVFNLAHPLIVVQEEILRMNPAFLTCREAELWAEFISAVFGPERAQAFIAVHAEGDELGDAHYLGLEN